MEQDTLLLFTMMMLDNSTPAPRITAVFLPFKRALLNRGFNWGLAWTHLATGPIKQLSSNVALKPSASNKAQQKMCLKCY